MTPRRRSARSASRKRRPSSGTPSESALQVGWVFALIFVVSLFLTTFVLYMQRDWRAVGQRTILLVHDAEDVVRKPLTLVVTKPLENSVVWLPLPPQQRVSLLEQDVEYSTDALVGWTQLEGLDWDYLRVLLGLEYGVFVDGIIWTQASPEEIDMNMIREVGRAALWRRAPTTITYWDRLTWWRWLRQVPVYEWEEIDLTAYLTDTNHLDLDRYQRSVLPQVVDQAIRQAGTTLSIQNASGIQGLANRVAQGLEMIGYEVRNIDTVDLQTETELLLSPADDVQLQEEQWARQHLTEWIPQLRVTTNEEDTRRRRVDAILRIGQNPRLLFEE